MLHFRRPTQPRPKWYLHALQNHPQSVADAFVAVARARVRRKEQPDQHLYDLPWEPEYGGVGPLAVPKMFAPFPSRCTKAQVVSLRLVLWAALNYMPPGDLRELVLQRLGRKGMDPVQRGTWLGAGLFVDREACLPRTLEFLVGDPDQAIYGWRGAELANIMSFQRDFPAARRIDLQFAYRSSARLLEAATAMIRHNADRLDHRLGSAN